MKYFIMIAAVLVSGCAAVPRTVTARVEIQSGTNKVSITQPKDTTIGRIVWNPLTGSFEMYQYASAANAGAIAAGQAQSQAVVDGVKAGFQMLKDMGIAGAAAYGGQAIPMGEWRVPEGMKAVERNGVVVLVPKDDPSIHHPEITP